VLQKILHDAPVMPNAAARCLSVSALYFAPAHIHSREDEVYLIKSGTFQFLMDGVCLQAEPGELANTKYGINHVPDHDFHAGACKNVKALK